MLLLPVKMDDKMELTKAFSVHRNYFQCYYNNVGYCKFRDQCRYQHYSKVCSRSVCKEKECHFRHPKSCKFGSDCHFLRRKCCVYNHKFSESNEKAFHNESETDLINEVTQLKVEIVELRKSVELKEQQLNEINVKEADANKLIQELRDESDRVKHSVEVNKKALDDLKRENLGLKEANEKLNELNATKQIQFIEILMKNEDLTSLLKQKSQENSNMNRFRFEKCDKDFPSKSELEELEESGKAHIKEHVDLLCGTCGHKFINIQKLKRHQQMFGHSS